MEAIEYVAERLYDTDSTDVEMKSGSVSEGGSRGSGSATSGKGSQLTLSLTNKLVSSPISQGNDDFHMKFSVTGTSSRPHHSGKRKVVWVISTIFLQIEYQHCYF